MQQQKAGDDSRATGRLGEGLSRRNLCFCLFQLLLPAAADNFLDLAAYLDTGVDDHQRGRDEGGSLDELRHEPVELLHNDRLLPDGLAP